MDNGQPYWKDKHYAFFCNKECEAFPCHEVSSAGWGALHA